MSVLKHHIVHQATAGQARKTLEQTEGQQNDTLDQHKIQLLSITIDKQTATFIFSCKMGLPDSNSAAKAERGSCKVKNMPVI